MNKTDFSDFEQALRVEGFDNATVISVERGRQHLLVRFHYDGDVHGMLLTGKMLIIPDHAEPNIDKLLELARKEGS